MSSVVERMGERKGCRPSQPPPESRACPYFAMPRALRRVRPQRALAQAALNDALLHLQAGEGGWMLVTRNAGDFGLLRRLAPGTEVFLY